MSTPEPKIVLTDPKPLPKDGRCPRCHAGPTKRQMAGGFGGPPFPVCTECGYEFPRED